MMAETGRIESATRAVAAAWFEALAKGDVETVAGLMADDIEFINYTPVPGYNDDMPWIGTYHGRQAVMESFGVFVGTCDVKSEKLVQLLVEGEQAMGVVQEQSVVKATGMSFEIEFVQWLTVRDGKIVRWKSYTDPSTIVRAIRGDA
jgi:ketosteroid isomerase-like protein